MLLVSTTKLGCYIRRAALTQGDRELAHSSPGPQALLPETLTFGLSESIAWVIVGKMGDRHRAGSGGVHRRAVDDLILDLKIDPSPFFKKGYIPWAHFRIRTTFW